MKENLLPVMRVYLNGSSMGTAPRNNSHVRAKRGAVVGWSAGAARRNTRFLYSIDVAGLSGVGFALTLTMRDTPSTAAEFGALRKAWIMRTMGRGAVRLHWIVEWQQRGTPHLHVAVYFPAEAVSGPPGAVRAFGWSMVDDWLEVAREYRPGAEGQDCKEISGAVGWLQYLSKHAARGAAHYQRAGHPEGWERTGRLWGHWGTWPVEQPMVFDVEPRAGVRYRRLVRSWRIADARQEKDRKTRARRVASARRMLKCSDRQLSPVRGVSEWLPEDVNLGFLALLASEGWEVTQRAQLE